MVNPSKELDIKKLNLTKAKEISEIFKTLEYDRQNSLYVGLIEKTNEILTPSGQINSKKCDILLASIELVFPIVEKIIKMDVDLYRKASQKLMNDNDGKEFAFIAEKGSTEFMGKVQRNSPT
jgi:hypothetical protein